MMPNKSDDDVELPAQDPAEGSREVIDHELNRRDRNKRPNSKRPSYWPKPARGSKLNMKGDSER